MNIQESTQAYELWLSGQLRLVGEDLRAKHQAMAAGAFPFLRATFYRWAQLWPELCPELAKAPTVLAVGDLHLENFGTWRDAEGRLIWGVNDFDEACPMPYTIDLVRLAASAWLAIHEQHLSCDPDKACDALLEGYTETIRQGGRPFVLAEHNRWLRDLARNKLREPFRYWKKLDQAGKPKTPPPPQVKRALIEDLPEKGLDCDIRHRRAGLGSLGRERFTLLTDWHGARIAREAKPLVPSAWLWSRGKAQPSKLWYQTILDQAVRVADPFLKVRGQWIIRRLAPDCSRIELSDLPEERDELRLLSAMGRETANIQLGNEQALAQVKKDLARRPGNWLRKAAALMGKATLNDFREWKARAPSKLTRGTKTV
jgi:hypothetical protein